jgi:hypothetical protein
MRITLLRVGQAVVQFATREHPREDVAIKFYVSQTAFKCECEQHTAGSPLQQFLPAVHRVVDNEDGGFVDRYEHALPPCIVMEKGESLDRWVKRNRRDLDQFTCMQVRLHPLCCAVALLNADFSGESTW